MAYGKSIGDLAKAAGVNVETIRYYQRLGLIHEPQKPAGGQRRYPDSAAGDLAFVRRAQQLGFTLAEIKELLRLAGGKNREEVREVARVRHSRLVLQARQLGAMSRKLKVLLDRSRRYRGPGPDPIIAALQGRKTRA